MTEPSVSVPRALRISVLLLCAALLSLCRPAAAQVVVDIGQTAVGGIPTGVGYADVAVYPTFAARAGYLNIVADLDSRGRLVWLVQNFRIPLQNRALGEFGAFSPALFSVTFPVNGAVRAGPLIAYSSFTPHPLANTRSEPMFPSLELSFSLFDVDDLEDGIEAGFTAGPVAPPSGPRLVPARAAISAPAQAAGTSGVIESVRKDIPGIKQGKNECAPTAVAQSLLWLQKRGKITIQLNGKPLTQGRLITGLKEAMNPNWNVAEGGTYPGVPTRQLLEDGKKAVIKRLGLPLSSESGGSDDGTGTFDFIKEQIEKGQDVELRIRGEDPTGGGHVVTVAGWGDNGKKQTIFLKDPLTGGDAIDSYELNGTQITGYKYVKELNGKKPTAFLGYAIAESPITK